jgi:sialate O-acetylesterase
MVDEDFVYFNGQQVGTTGYRYPPRYYTIPNLCPTLSDNTKCVLTIRLLNQYGTPDVTASKPLWLILEDSEGETYTLDLNTEWKYQRGCVTSRRQEMTFITYKPSALYNGMIAPLKNLNLTGIAYYQGESDTNAPELYGQKFVELIASWRELFNKTASELPFIFTQIAYQFYTYDEDWDTLRAGQVQALEAENTGMIFTQDIGEYNDLHPTNKYLVGYRLSRLARKLAYGERIKQTPFEVVGSWQMNEFERK